VKRKNIFSDSVYSHRRMGQLYRGEGLGNLCPKYNFDSASKTLFN